MEIDYIKRIEELQDQKYGLKIKIYNIENQIKELEMDNLKNYFNTNRYFKYQSNSEINLYFLTKDIEEYEIYVGKNGHSIEGNMVYVRIRENSVSIEIEEGCRICFGRDYEEAKAITEESFKSLIEDATSNLIMNKQKKGKNGKR